MCLFSICLDPADAQIHGSITGVASGTESRSTYGEYKILRKLRLLIKKKGSTIICCVVFISSTRNARKGTLKRVQLSNGLPLIGAPLDWKGGGGVDVRGTLDRQA